MIPSSTAPMVFKVRLVPSGLRQPDHILPLCVLSPAAGRAFLGHGARRFERPHTCSIADLSGRHLVAVWLVGDSPDA